MTFVRKASIAKEPVHSRTQWQEIYATGSVLKRLEATKRFHRYGSFVGCSISGPSQRSSQGPWHS